MTVDDFSQIAMGSVLVDKYRITREIGRGGMAAVFEAENLGLGKRVAVKVLAAELTTSKIVRERFLREARAAAAVRSPYICDVYDVGEFDNRPFLVMELLEGESLYDRMTRVRRLDIPTTLRIMTQTAKGLAKAHAAGIVHRDLKPENLFLTRNEEGEVVTKLLDFGLAKFYEPTNGGEQVRLTREGALFGTPAYMSPEQAKGRGEVDHRADLWALGCIVYECLTGHTVWNVDQGVAMILAQVANAPIPLATKIRPDLPTEFDLWLNKALQRSPDDRFQTAGQFAIALSEALSPGNSNHLKTPSMLVDVDDVLQQVTEHDRAGSDRVSEVDSKAYAQYPEPPKPKVPRRAGAAAAPESVRSRVPQSQAAHGRTALAEPQGPKVIESAPPQFRPRGRRYAVLAAVLLLGAAGAAYPYRAQISHYLPRFLWPTDSAAGHRAHATAALGALPPLETSGFAGTVLEAQLSLLDAKPVEAEHLLDEAIKNGGEGIATNLRTHVKASQETPAAPCQLRALGRPRPFNVADPPSRPTIMAYGKQAVVAWVDAHEEKSRRQLYSTVLDEALRRVSEPSLVSPESLNARYPHLIGGGTDSAVFFWDATQKQEGLFARKLDEQGRTKGALKELAKLSRDDYTPAIAPAEDGSYWIAWEDDATQGSLNLAVRHIDNSFAPLSGVVHLSALKPDRALKPSAIHPAIAVSNGKLRVLFTLRIGAQRRVYSMVLDTKSNDLAPDKPPSVSAPGLLAEHRFRVVPQPLGREGANSDNGAAHCLTDTCFLLWDEDAVGIVATAIDPRNNGAIWRHEVGPRGTRPSLGATDTKMLAAWYEASRVRVAEIDRSGVGTVSTIGKVSGIQPPADVAATQTQDRWLLAWRDYESGHFEAMAAMVTCYPGKPR